MAIELHRRCVEAVLSKLPSALGELRISSKQFIDYQSIEPINALDEALPKHGEVAERLGRIIGPQPLSTFILDRIGDLLEAEFSYESSAQDIFLELPHSESIEQLASRLIDEFRSLPWPHQFLYELPTEIVDPLLAPDQSSFEAGLGTSIMMWAPEHAGELPSGERKPLGLFLGTTGPKEGSGYLKVVLDGYVPRYGSGATAEESDRRMRSVCGLGMALRVWERGSTGGSLGGLFGPQRTQVLQWRNRGAGWEYRSARQLPTELGEALLRLRVNPRLQDLGARGLQAYARYQMNDARRLHQHDEGASISRAARWLFDSYVGSNELLSFVQATVSAEILLGDKAVSDITGLTELLANRCAYLIGNTRAQRDKLLSDFRQIYSTRSRIVHRGLDELNEQDRERLWNLRWICTRIIQREMELLFPKTKTP